MEDGAELSDRILVVDDSPGTLSMIQSALDDARYLVSVAKNGDKGLRIASRSPPDLILLDVMMPEMDGYETCRRLKEDERTRNIPVIFLTGVTDTHDKVKGFSLGAVDFLTKPVEIEELLARVHTHVSRSKLKRQLVDANRNLEARVEERTAELSRLNLQLSKEVAERRRAEREILKKNEELSVANEELTATEEELRKNYEELSLTDLKLQASETNFRDVLENSIVALYKRNYTTNTYDYISPAITGITGYSPEEVKDMPIRKAYDLIHPEDVRRVKEGFKSLITSGGGPFTVEYRIRNKAGEYRWAEEFGQIIVDEEKKPLLGIGSIQDITDRKIAEEGLSRATRRLNFLNSTVFSDIQNAIFSLNGYLQIERDSTSDKEISGMIDLQQKIVDKISESMKFARIFQNLGIRPPERQNVTQMFLFGASHLDLSTYSRDLQIDDLEIFADPLLEQVFFTLAENVIRHSMTATKIRLWYRETEDGITLFFEDNGQGIPEERKSDIFERIAVNKKGLGLFLAREILSITNIGIRETGVPGEGARIEMHVPKGSYWRT